MNDRLTAGHTLICTGCGQPVGYAHDTECEFDGTVVTSEAVDAEGQPRCVECKQRLGRSHLQTCSRLGTVQEGECEEPLELSVLPSPLCQCGHRFDHHGANSKGPSACHVGACPCMGYVPQEGRSDVSVRAEQVVRELTSAARTQPVRTQPEEDLPLSPVVVVQMHDDSPTTPTAVIQSIASEEASAAEVVIGIWGSGHVVVGKNRHGQAGAMDAAKVGPKIVDDLPPEWPAKLIWGMYRDSATGHAGPLFHPSDIESTKSVYPNAEVEPYIPVRNLKAALTALRNEADHAAEGAPLATSSDWYRGQACAFDDALDLLKAACWELEA